MPLHRMKVRQRAERLQPSFLAYEWHASPGAYTDSLPASAVGAPFSKIPVHAEWGDSVQFRFYAIDASGNVSDTVRSGSAHLT